MHQGAAAAGELLLDLPELAAVPTCWGSVGPVVSALLGGGAVLFASKQASTRFVPEASGSQTCQPLRCLSCSRGTAGRSIDLPCNGQLQLLVVEEATGFSAVRPPSASMTCR